MNKKVFYISVILVFLWSENSTLGVRSRAEEWNDSGCTPAPILVRQAADVLWDTVEAEYDARLHFNSATAFHLSDLLPLLLNSLRGLITPQPNAIPINLNHEKASDLLISCHMNIYKAYYKFQRVVRKHVHGRFWFGDIANDDNQDEWTPNQKWKVKLPEPDKNYHRDMRSVLSATLTFVNAWGGWVHEVIPIVQTEN